MSPQRIDKATALERIASGNPVECVPCELARSLEPLAQNAHAVAVLSRYPARWGHVLVVLREHRVRLDDVSPEAWTNASQLAHAAGRAIERALDPARCYVASLGTAVAGLPMSFPHLHWHVIPVPEADTRPAEVFTWKHGVYEGSDEQWAALRDRLKSVWPG